MIDPQVVLAYEDLKKIESPPPIIVHVMGLINPHLPEENWQQREARIAALPSAWEVK